MTSNALAKLLLDRGVAVAGLVSLAPAFAILMLLVWRHDRRSPLYVTERVALGGGGFRMMKIRSMVADAERLGASSTAADDPRVTPVGRFIRRWKIDEFSQLWNVAAGDMSLVGPRPQVVAEVATYTAEERRLLEVKPGITDFSSIVFADEADILHGASDPDLAYRHLIRPWKSRLSLFYVDHASVWLDVQLIALTIVRLFSRQHALAGASALLARLAAPTDLVRIALRDAPLVPAAVPGMSRPFGA